MPETQRDELNLCKEHYTHCETISLQRQTPFEMTSKHFVLTAEALSEALPDMDLATRAIHADDFYSGHRAIAPSMHVAVNYRYARDPDDLVFMDNTDVCTATHPLHFILAYLTCFLYSPMLRMTLIFMDVILTPTPPGLSLLPAASLGAELLLTRAASLLFTLSWFY